MIKNHVPGSYTVTGHETNAAAGHLTDDTDTITVATGYFLVVSPTVSTVVTAGNTVGVYAQIVDQNGANVATSNVQITFTTTNGSLNPLYTTTDATGRAYTTLTTSLAAGTTHQVTAVAASPAMSGVSAVITTAQQVSFAISAPSNAMQSWPFNIQVRAKDGTGATVATYVGTVHFTSTEGTAVLPVDYTFQASDNGTHTFVVTLNAQGSWKITAQDTVTSAINGTWRPAASREVRKSRDRSRTQHPAPAVEKSARARPQR